MKVIILAAGYATRLYPLTLTQPKPLLPVAGKPMVEHVLDNLAPIAAIDRVYVVTNAKFATHFQTWSEHYRATKSKFEFTVVNDGSTDDSNKLGAIGDINLVVERENLASSDLVVVAGDNLFSQSLEGFAAEARKHPAAIATYDVGDLEAIKKYNNIETDSNGVVTHFEEKPKHPSNTITGIALYYYSKEVVPMFGRYLAEGNNPDQPGRFVQWLYKLKPVFAYQVGGTWFDIGSKETLEEANRIFQKFV